MCFSGTFEKCITAKGSKLAITTLSTSMGEKIIMEKIWVVDALQTISCTAFWNLRKNKKQPFGWFTKEPWLGPILVKLSE